MGMPWGWAKGRFMVMLYWFMSFLRSCLTFARRFWNQFCSQVSHALLYRIRRATGATRIDLVEGDAKAGREFLLDIGAGLVLGEEMLLEDIVLVLCEARLDIAARRFGRRRSGCRGGGGGVHGAASSDEAGRARAGRGGRGGCRSKGGRAW